MAMLNVGSAYYELPGELWRGPWELWVATPEDVADGRIGREITRTPFPLIYGALAEG
jgi:hypothetical protein